MGTHKAFLRVKDKRMIDIILDVFQELFDEIVIVTNDKERFLEFKGVKVVEDIIKEKGPLAGIYTGLKSIKAETAFFVACDMPFLHNGFIKRMLDLAQGEDVDCIVPRSQGRIEPLHAIYSKEVIPMIEALLRGKDLSMKKLLEMCKCLYIDSKGNEERSFYNVNTKEELKELYACKI